MLFADSFSHFLLALLSVLWYVVGIDLSIIVIDESIFVNRLIDI